MAISQGSIQIATTTAVPPLRSSVAEDVGELVVNEPGHEGPQLRSAGIKARQSLDDVQPDVLNEIIDVRPAEARLADEFPGLAPDELLEVWVVWIRRRLGRWVGRGIGRHGLQASFTQARAAVHCLPRGIAGPTEARCGQKWLENTESLSARGVALSRCMQRSSASGACPENAWRKRWLKMASQQASHVPGSREPVSEYQMALVVRHEEADDETRPHCLSVDSQRGLLPSLRSCDLFSKLLG
jgi:hypothetical protein